MEKHSNYENEVISCVNDIVNEKFSDEFELVFDSTEPCKTGFKSKTTDFECEVTFKGLDVSFNILDGETIDLDFDHLTDKSLYDVICGFYYFCKM